MQLAVLCLGAAVFLTALLKVNAIIPMPCANLASLNARECCPVPSQLGENHEQCGKNLGRGSCEAITVPDPEYLYNPAETDVRANWPIQYFSRACKCNERFGGVDCGECSYAYNDGTTSCTEKTIYARKSVGGMSTKTWRYYRGALRVIKDNPSRYMVSTADYTDEVMRSLVRPTTYNLFVWLHHFVAKDNEASKNCC